MNLESEHRAHSTYLWRLPQPAKHKLRAVSVCIRNKHDYPAGNPINDRSACFPSEKQNSTNELKAVAPQNGTPFYLSNEKNFKKCL